VAYIPLFVQTVAGARATTAGIVLTPWCGLTVASIIGGRLLGWTGLGRSIKRDFFLSLGFAGIIG
jgi:hypothetical protein